MTFNAFIHLAPGIFLHILENLEPSELQAFIHYPLSKAFHRNISTSPNVWNHACVFGPWELSLEQVCLHSQDPRELFMHLLHLDNQLPRMKQLQNVIQALHEYDWIPVILIKCIQQIESLTEEESHRQEFSEQKHITKLLQIMQLFADDGRLQAAACRSLVTIARPIGGTSGSVFAGTTALTSVAEDIGKGNGTHLILEAMRNHQNNPTLQAMACWSIVNIALNPRQKVRIIRDGGIQLIFSALRNHPNAREVHHRANLALVNLVVSDHVMQEFPPDAISLILRSLDEYDSDKNIVSFACIVLKNLSADVNTLDYLRAQSAERQLARIADSITENVSASVNARLILSRLEQSVQAIPAY